MKLSDLNVSIKKKKKLSNISVSRYILSTDYFPSKYRCQLAEMLNIWLVFSENFNLSLIFISNINPSDFLRKLLFL